MLIVRVFFRQELKEPWSKFKELIAVAELPEKGTVWMAKIHGDENPKDDKTKVATDWYVDDVQESRSSEIAHDIFVTSLGAFSRYTRP